MPTVYLSPIGNDAPFYAHGTQLVDGKLYTYVAESTTAQSTYNARDGLVANANPMRTNSEGYPAAAGNRIAVWLAAGVRYKFVLTDANDVTLWSTDNVSGINDISLGASEWLSVANNVAPTYVATTQFTLPGDHTADAVVDRWAKTTNSGGISYGIVLSSVYASGITTVTLVNVSGVLDAGLSIAQWGVLRPDHPSVPLDADNLAATAVASAATTNIWGINGNYAHITGTTGITSFGQASHAGARRRVVFDGILTLTYNASTLITPGLTDLVTAVGDSCDVNADTITKMVLSNYQRATGLPVANPPQYGGTSTQGLAATNNATTPNSQLDITMFAATLRKSDGTNNARNNSFSGTVDFAVQGVNGRDQVAAFSASSTVHIYRIWDGTNDGLIASASGPPTQANGASYPAAYTYQCYLFSVVLDGSANLRRLYVRGDNVTLQVSPTLFTVAGTAVAETTQSLTTWMPAIASEYAIHVFGAVGLNSSGSATLSIRIATGVTHATIASSNTSGHVNSNDGFVLPNVGQQFLYVYAITTTSFGGVWSTEFRSYRVPNSA